MDEHRLYKLAQEFESEVLDYCSKTRCDSKYKDRCRSHINELMIALENAYKHSGRQAFFKYMRNAEIHTDKSLKYIRKIRKHGRVAREDYLLLKYKCLSIKCLISCYLYKDKRI